MKNLSKILIIVLFLVMYANLEAKALRIVSISPSITEIIFALGGESNLVGVTSSCDYPKRARNLPSIGDFATPNLEKIVALKPDLVIGMGNPGSSKNFLLQKMGIKTIVLNSPNNFQDIYKIICEIGLVLDKQAKAKNLVNNLKYSVCKYKVNPNFKSKSVIILIWQQPLMAVSNKSFVSEIVEAAGFKNLLKTKTHFPVISKEFLYAANPDYIILAEPRIKNFFIEANTFANLKAVKNKHVIYKINTDWLLRPGPRFVNAIKQLQEQ
ncbi:MAG: helical backbone metal receptor [Candidatus Margulisiibacteriota bacterium]|jgi:iron complex transport system substrate-binding protein